jgi:hypothetical protein
MIGPEQVESWIPLRVVSRLTPILRLVSKDRNILQIPLYLSTATSTLPLLLSVLVSCLDK